MNPKLPKISIWNTSGGFIILCPSGVNYSNQSGGVACMHPAQEGAFLPFEDHEGGALAGLAVDVIGLSQVDADQIDQRLDAVGIDAKVDRTRLDNSMEAWVYVTLYGWSDLLMENIDFPIDAILCYPNSD